MVLLRRVESLGLMDVGRAQRPVLPKKDTRHFRDESDRLKAQLERCL